MSSVWEEKDSRASLVVMGCVPVSAMTSTRSGALWRVPPRLAVFADDGMD